MAKAPLSQRSPLWEGLGGDTVRPSRQSGDGPVKRPYEQWTKDELYRRARGLHIEGRSTMTKQQLIEALRDVR